VARLVEFEADRGFAWIRLNREDKRNAMNQRARDELRSALDDARAFPAAVITGADRSFCAGVDLQEVREQAAVGSEHALADWSELNLGLREHPAVLIAAVNGIALGGGSTLAGMCDLAIAAHEAEFGLPEIGFGMYPNPAGPVVQMGLTRKRAAWLVLTARRIDGRTAAAWGLVNESVPGDELTAAAAVLARHIAQFDRAALIECKRALDLIPLADWRAAFELGVATNARIKRASGAVDDALERFRRPN
jgi:feruloyl-CoA hydratase/lyase